MLENRVARSATAAPKERAEVARRTKVPTAAKSASRTVAAKSTGRQDELQERVRQRAYELWESEGRPAGREYDHWLQAERELASTPRQRAA